MLADPARHRELDSAGMLRGLDSGDAPITAAGQAFVMNIEPETDIGDYQMRNEIVIYEADRRDRLGAGHSSAGGAGPHHRPA